MSNYPEPNPIPPPLPIFNPVNWPQVETGGGVGGGGFQGPTGATGQFGVQGLQGQGFQGFQGNFDVSGNLVTSEFLFYDSLTNVVTYGTIPIPSSTDLADPIRIGTNAGITSQSLGAIAIGVNAGNLNQSAGIAVGNFAATDYQSPNAIAVGSVTGQFNQGDSAVAIGNGAGQYYQSQNGIAIGSNCGVTGQGREGISIGFFAGYDTQGQDAISIGTYAGHVNQGANSIAIGHQAAGQFTPQVANSIILNASGILVDATESSFYVAPVREGPTGGTGYALIYDTTTKEVMYTTSHLIGEQGFQGLDGLGTQGFQGGDGLGTQGFQGIMGSGTQGSQGDTGSPGTAGPAGPTGATGDWSLIDQQTFTRFTTSYPNYGSNKMWMGVTGVPAGWRAAAVSASGKYMISTAQSGANLYSINYGKTWAAYGGGNGWSNALSLSASGQHQLISGGYSNGIVVSNDYGTTFTTRISGIGIFSNCMSASGDVMYCCPLNGSDYYRSTDFGTTWTQITPPTGQNIYKLACSSNGKVLMLGGTPNTFISFDGGNTFTVTTGEGFVNVSMNTTGQYMYRAGNGFDAYISRNYGQTWTYVGAWPYCVWSASGQYSALMTGSQIHISGDYGFNYQLSYTGSFSDWTDHWLSGISMSANGQYILTGTNPSNAVPSIYQQVSTFVPQFAQYYDTTDQANSGATGNTLLFNTTDFEAGVSMVSSSQLTVSQTGYYQVSYSIQLLNVNSQEQYVDIWFEKNGAVIPNSNSLFAIVRNQSGVDGKVIATSTFYFKLVANDYLQIRWFCATTDVDVEYIPAGAFIPATPSAFVNINLICEY